MQATQWIGNSKQRGPFSPCAKGHVAAKVRKGVKWTPLQSISDYICVIKSNDVALMMLVQIALSLMPQDGLGHDFRGSLLDLTALYFNIQQLGWIMLS